MGINTQKEEQQEKDWLLQEDAFTFCCTLKLQVYLKGVNVFLLLKTNK